MDYEVVGRRNAMKNIFIFGDSYSTYQGYIPEGYAPYYPNLDVRTVEETWWKRFADKTGAHILQNNSWSGSTICCTGYDGVDCSQTNAFIYRYEKLKAEGFFDENKVDTLLVFGGTNDSWSDAPLGKEMLADWKREDLFCVLPAICYFACLLKKDLPNTEIVFMLNTDLKKEIGDCFVRIAEAYGVKTVVLENIDKDSGHPTSKGMEQICAQLIQSISSNN
jgi:hypothetical protein